MERTSSAFARFAGVLYIRLVSGGAASLQCNAASSGISRLRRGGFSMFSGFAGSRYRGEARIFPLRHNRGLLRLCFTIGPQKGICLLGIKSLATARGWGDHADEFAGGFGNRRRD